MPPLPPVPPLPPQAVDGVSPPLDLAALVGILTAGEVRFVVNGSVAALWHGVDLEPGDLDLTPEPSAANLERLARVLDALGAKPKFVAAWRDSPTLTECRAWTPWPVTLARLDHRFVTPWGELDVVPERAGSYAELAPAAGWMEVPGGRVPVAAAADVLRYWRRWNRDKDRARIPLLEAVIARGRGA